MSARTQRQVRTEQAPQEQVTDEDLKEELGGDGMEVIDISDRNSVKPTTWHVPA